MIYLSKYYFPDYPLPGAGLIRYIVEQAYKVLSNAEKDDLEKIRKAIQELKLALNIDISQTVKMWRP